MSEVTEKLVVTIPQDIQTGINNVVVLRPAVKTKTEAGIEIPAHLREALQKQKDAEFGFKEPMWLTVFLIDPNNDRGIKPGDKISFESGSSGVYCVLGGQFVMTANYHMIALVKKTEGIYNEENKTLTVEKEGLFEPSQLEEKPLKALKN